jgi:hypothetical protein
MLRKKSPGLTSEVAKYLWLSISLILTKIVLPQAKDI